MKELVLQTILNDVDKVDHMIYMFQVLFDDIASRYTKNVGHTVSSYFTTGHCGAFARLLINIFEGNVEIYVGNGHILTKVGPSYCDITGCHKELPTTANFEKYSLDEFELIEDVYRTNDEIELKIMEDYYTIGKKMLEEYKQRIENSKSPQELHFLPPS